MPFQFVYSMINRKMKILHYIPSVGKTGGGVSSYLQLLSHDMGQLVDLKIVCHYTSDELTFTNCTIHYIEGSVRRPFKMKREFCAILDKFKPDVVHVNGCWMLQCSWIVFWAKAKGYPIALSPHGMLEPWDIRKNYWTKKLPALLLYQKRSVKMSNVLIATAETEKKNLLSLGYNSNVTVVPNGIIIDGIEAKKTWNEKKQILFLALYRKNKGINLLMEAVAHTKEQLAGWKVIIAGIEADYTVEDLKRMADRLGISSIIEVVGPLYGDDKWNAYRSSDVFVLPTLNENFGIVIAESFLCGTPVVTTKGTPWPMIEQYHCGWWIDRSLNNLVNAILEVIHTPIQERKEMGLRGKELVTKNFASPVVARRMVEVYNTIIQK